MSLRYSRNSLHTIPVLGSTMFNIFINDLDVMEVYLLSLQMTPNHGRRVVGVVEGLSILLRAGLPPRWAYTGGMNGLTAAL